MRLRSKKKSKDLWMAYQEDVSGLTDSHWSKCWTFNWLPLPWMSFRVFVCGMFAPLSLRYPTNIQWNNLHKYRVDLHPQNNCRTASSWKNAMLKALLGVDCCVFSTSIIIFPIGCDKSLKSAKQFAVSHVFKTFHISFVSLARSFFITSVGLKNPH